MALARPPCGAQAGLKSGLGPALYQVPLIRTGEPSFSVQWT